MKSMMDRRTYALLKAAEIEAEKNRRPGIPGFPIRNYRRTLLAAPMKVARMDPAAVEELLHREAAEKHWGNQVLPIQEQRTIANFVKRA